MSFVYDWLGNRRTFLREQAAEFDANLYQQVTRLRDMYDRTPREFDQAFPAPDWDESRPATFVWYRLLRTLVADAKGFRFKKGDASDFCHAVAGGAFSDLATLDNQWKRRMTGLPTPNGVARVYSSTELDEFVDAIEAGVNSTN